MEIVREAADGVSYVRACGAVRGDTAGGAIHGEE